MRQGVNVTLAHNFQLDQRDDKKFGQTDTKQDEVQKTEKASTDEYAYFAGEADYNLEYRTHAEFCATVKCCRDEDTGQ